MFGPSHELIEHLDNWTYWTYQMRYLSKATFFRHAIAVQLSAAQTPCTEWLRSAMDDMIRHVSGKKDAGNKLGREEGRLDL